MSDRAQRRLDYLELQVQNLYGPLNYLISFSQTLNGLTVKINEVYKREYIDKEYADNPVTTSISSEAAKTIDLENKYVRLIMENFERFAEILEKHYQFVDADDAAMCQRVILDQLILRRRYAAIEASFAAAVKAEIFGRADDPVIGRLRELGKVVGQIVATAKHDDSNPSGR